MPREVIISQTYRPGSPEEPRDEASRRAPCSRHSRRYAALVMPAIGASTTGASTRSGPSCNAVMPPLSQVRGSALLLALGLLRRRRLGRGDVALPEDRVELLAGPVAHGAQCALVGREVDQAGVQRRPRPEL